MEFTCDQVQQPPKGLFHSDHLVWFPCKKQGSGVVRKEAWIPLDRFKDFKTGEETRPQFQCSFKITKTEVKKSSGQITRTYWCSYGPKDERSASINNWATMQDNAKKSLQKGKGLGSRPAARIVDAGLSVRRGCRCHFKSVTDARKEEAVLISWIEQRHVDLAGEYSHGLLCADAKQSNAHIAPRHQNGVPVVWAILQRHTTQDLQLIQEKIKSKVEAIHGELLGGDKNFQPSCFICDDSAEEKASIRAVYPGIPIDLCIWHVRCAFNKNLTSKVQHPVHRALMNRELANIMYRKEGDPYEVSSAFVQKWIGIEPRFVAYYEKQWLPKLEEWVVKYRCHKRANQNTTGAVERWHATLKAHIRSSRFTRTQRRLSWLVQLLSTTIELYYWCSAELKLQGRIRNRVVEDQVVTVCIKAKSIPDKHVQWTEIDGTLVRTCQSQSKPGGFYIISERDSGVPRCTCSQSSLGNLCKHEVKVLMMDGVSETQIVKSLGRKFGSEVGGLQNLRHQVQVASGSSSDPVPEEPEFHFPFEMEEDSPIDQEAAVATEDIIKEINKFADKVERDPFYLSHFLVRCREASEQVLNMKANLENNTGIHEEVIRTIPHPFEPTPDVESTSRLERKKGWFERMMEEHTRKPNEVRSDEQSKDVAIPLERTSKPVHVSLNCEFDGDALEYLLGGDKDASAEQKKRKRKALKVPKIGSQKRKHQTE
ncbi:hypothetical protein R1sor_006408 [Riccia sorocarpa]|uniref:SWIM-type domain-containing protein n=1 Tax=Riccia sorocarpa TaxID=122646 RepID=A0ABD3HQY5_9MARC